MNNQFTISNKTFCCILSKKHRNRLLDENSALENADIAHITVMDKIHL